MQCPKKRVASVNFIEKRGIEYLSNIDNVCVDYPWYFAGKAMTIN